MSVDYQWIEDDESLAELCERFKNAPVLALDTEFERSSTFFPKLGLLQISDGEHIALIDPLAIRQFTPLKSLLESENATVLLHSCSEDLEVLQCAFDCIPAKLLDTQTGAALAGWGFGLSYQNMVQHSLGVFVPKEETRSNWIKRPLTDAQKDYAALDVLYLHKVYEQLSDILKGCGRLSWWQEEGATLVSAAKNPPSANEYYRKHKQAFKLDRRQLAVLQKVCNWREHATRAKDLPRSWLLADAQCFEIARTLPKSENELAAIKGVAGKFAQRNGHLITDLVKAALALPEAELPDPIPRPLDAEQKKQLKRLQNRARALAQEQGFNPELLSRKKDFDHMISYGTLPNQGWNGWRFNLMESNLEGLV